MCSRRFSYVSNARGLGRSAAAGTSLVMRVPRRSLAWSSAKLLGGDQRGDQRGNQRQSEAIIRGRSGRPSEAIRGNRRQSEAIIRGRSGRPSEAIREAIRGDERSSVLGGSLTRGCLMRQAIQGHPRPSEVIRGHQRRIAYSRVPEWSSSKESKRRAHSAAEACNPSAVMSVCTALQNSSLSICPL